MLLIYKCNESSYQDNKPVGTVSEHLQASSYEIPWDVRIETLPVNSGGSCPLAGLAGLA